VAAAASGSARRHAYRRRMRRRAGPLIRIPRRRLHDHDVALPVAVKILATELAVADAFAADLPATIGPDVRRRTRGTGVPGAEAPDRVTDIAERLAGEVRLNGGGLVALTGGAERFG